MTVYEATAWEGTKVRIEREPGTKTLHVFINDEHKTEFCSIGMWGIFWRGLRRVIALEIRLRWLKLKSFFQ